MNCNEAIRYMMDKRKISQQALAEKLGYQYQARVSDHLRSSVKGQLLARVAELLEYDIVMYDRHTVERIEITYDPDFESKRAKK